MATTTWDTGRKKTLRIPSGQQNSDVLNLALGGMKESLRLGLISPGTLTGVITIEVSDTDTGTFATLQSDGTDINLAAGKASVLSPFPFPYMRLHSTLAEGANRDFVIMGQNE